MSRLDFNAFGLVPIIQNAPFKITSIATYNDHIYCGTKDGRIVVYRNEPGTSELLSCKLVRGKRVENLIIAGPLQRLLALCGGSVHVLDLYTLQRRKSAEKQMNKKVKGCGIFCLDQSGPPHWRLCFAVKRKLVLFEHDNLKDGDWVFMKELAVPEQCSAICVHGDSICVGYRKQYYVIRVVSGETVDVGLMLDGAQDPFIQVLPGPQFLLGGMQGVGVLVDVNADPTSGVVEWSGDIKGSAYTFPYLVSLVQQYNTKEAANSNGGSGSSSSNNSSSSGSSSSGGGSNSVANGVKDAIGGAVEGLGNVFKGASSSSSNNNKARISKMIEIHSVIDQHRLVQKIQVPPDSIALVDNSNHVEQNAMTDDHANRYGATASKVTSELLFASTTAVYQIKMFPYEKQVHELLNQSEIDAAHGLLSATTSEGANRQQVMDEFSLKAGVILFLNLKFTECIPYIQKSMLDLRELLQLFPELQPITGLGIDFEPNFVLPRSAGGTLPNNVTDMLSLVRSMRKKRRNILLQEQKNGGSASAASRASKRVNQQGYSNDATDDKVVEIAKECLLKICLHRRKMMMSTENDGDGNGNGDGDGDINVKNHEQKVAATKAVSSLLPDLSLVDTCIFHIYASMTASDTTTTFLLLEQFVSDTSNQLSMEDVTGVLQRQSLFHVLALLNACKGRKRDALEIWMRIGNGEYLDAANHQGVKETVQYLCNLNSDSDLEPDSSTAASEQEDNNLVWRFSSWVLRNSPEKGILIFTESKRAFALNSDRVLEFLLSFLQQDSSSAHGGADSNRSNGSIISNSNNSTSNTSRSEEKQLRWNNYWPRQARVTYLDYLIASNVNIDQHYHTMLGLELIAMTIHALEHGWDSDATNEQTRRSAHAEDLASRLSNPGGFTQRKKRHSNAQHGKFPPIRRKLLDMLRTTNKYNNQQLLTATSGKGLYEERVLLLANAKKHDEALRTLVFDLRDSNEAERYCTEHSPNIKEDPLHQQSLFLPLIKLYLERGENNIAMALLKRHAPRIDAIQAMSQLPEVATISTMQPFLQNMLRHNESRRSQAIISKNLAKTLYLNVRCKLAILETRAVVTSNSTRCCVCQTLIAPNTVFVVFPAGEIAHLKCCKGTDGLKIHPLTKEKLEHANKDLAYKWKFRG